MRSNLAPVDNQLQAVTPNLCALSSYVTIYTLDIPSVISPGTQQNINNRVYIGYLRDNNPTTYLAIRADMTSNKPYLFGDQYESTAIEIIESSQTPSSSAMDFGNNYFIMGNEPFTLSVAYYYQAVQGTSSTESCPTSVDGWIYLRTETKQISNVVATTTTTTLSCRTAADTNCDGMISNTELMVSINAWKAGTLTRANLGIIGQSWSTQ